MNSLKFWIGTFLLGGALGSNSYGQYLENGKGYVLMEAEKTTSVLTPCWTYETQKSPSEGKALRQANCNNTSSGPALAPLKYTFTIQTAGTYNLHLKIWKDHALTNDSTDKSNDVYVRVEGDFVSGSTNSTVTLPTADLKGNVKLYGGSSTAYEWSGNASLDIHEKKWSPKYIFKAGQTYSLYMSARAKNVNVDRIVFATDAALAVGQASGTADSPTDGSVIVDPPAVGTKIIYKAKPDFTLLPATGDFAAYSPDNLQLRPNVAMIDASKPANRLKWAAAEVVFNGTPGTYTFNLSGMKETDGETSYKIYVNGTQVGTTFKNEFINLDEARDYEIQIHTVPSVTLAKNDKIRVESDCHSNGKKQEAGQPAGTWAWARGRWSQIELVPATTAIRFLSRANNSGIEVLSQPHNSAIQFSMAGSNPGTLSVYSASGSLVKSISVAGQSISWDKKTKAGHIVNPGVYSAVFMSQGQLFSRSFVVF